MTRTERQILGVNKWKESNGRATLCWATGCGKTNGACIAINRVLKIAPNTIIKIIIELIFLESLVFFIKYFIAGSTIKEIINATKNGM